MLFPLSQRLLGAVTLGHIAVVYHNSLNRRIIQKIIRSSFHSVPLAVLVSKANRPRSILYRLSVKSLESLDYALFVIRMYEIKGVVSD
jgi:hypothetical protein